LTRFNDFYDQRRPMQVRDFRQASADGMLARRLRIVAGERQSHHGMPEAKYLLSKMYVRGDSSSVAGANSTARKKPKSQPSGPGVT
jgi:hypothetical protein